MSDREGIPRTDEATLYLSGNGYRYAATIPRGAYDITVSVDLAASASDALHENARDIVQHVANMAKKAMVGTISK